MLETELHLAVKAQTDSRLSRGPFEVRTIARHGRQDMDERDHGD